MKMTDDELIAEDDRLAHHRTQLSSNETYVGIEFFLDELARRRTDRQTQEIARPTWSIAGLTAVVTAGTVVTTIAAIVLLSRPG